MSEENTQPIETPAPTPDAPATSTPSDALATVSDSSEDGHEGELPPPAPPEPALLPPPRDPVVDAEERLRKFEKVSASPRFVRLKDGMQHMAAVFGDFHPAVDALRAALVKLFDDA